MSKRQLDPYYQALGLDRHACKEDIVQAYRQMKQTYQPGSLSTYSLFTADEQQKILHEIEVAYQILSSDQVQGMIHQEKSRTSIHPFPAQKNRMETLSHIKPATHSPAMQERMHHHAIWDGAFLRACREDLALTLQDIANSTCIALAYLQAFEQEDVAAMPKGVFFNSYLRQYAQAIRLQPEEILKRYPHQA